VAGARPFFRPRNGWLEVRRPARSLQFLRFTLADPSSDDDWGVSEILVYEDVGGRPGADRPPDTAAVLEALKRAGLSRLLADVGVSARVARASGGEVRTLPANGVLDANGWAPPAWLARDISLRGTDGLLVGPDDAEDVRRRLAGEGLRFRETPVGDHQLFSGLAPLPAPFACERPRRSRVTQIGLTEDGKGASYRVEAELSETQPVAGLRLDHPFVSTRHVPVPVLVASGDGRSWKPIEVRRLTTWAWAGRTLFRVTGGREELAIEPTALRYLRLEVRLPYVGDDALRQFCVRVVER
jgi:hypothetical protein